MALSLDEKLPDLVGKTVAATYYKYGEVVRIGFTDGTIIEINERMTGGQLSVCVFTDMHITLSTKGDN